MLVENKNISQKEKGFFRRWFSDDYLDLILWYTERKNELVGFQNRSKNLDKKITDLILKKISELEV